MIRYKSRSECPEFGKKSHKSAFRRTLSASRFCRGDPLISQIDKNALKPVQREPPDRENSSEKQVVEIAKMQQYIGQIEEKLKNVEEELNVTRGEKDRTLEELREAKIAVREASSKPTETLPSPMIGEVLKMKEKEIKSLKLELKKARGLEIDKEAKIRIQELEGELERSKLRERKVYERSVSQTKQLEGTQIELDETKLEASSLRQAITKLMALRREKSSINSEEAYDNEEINSLKTELNSAIKAEEKSNKAMEDLAIALKEVASEANQAKQELASSVLELGHVKEEAEQLKGLVRAIEDKYKNQLEDADKEIGRCKNTIERLILEAEESLLAWNDKELGFVSCIKKAVEDNLRLAESLKQAEMLNKTSKEENLKLRDILKHALNEANVAKEAANIARIENSQLEDFKLEKEEALNHLAQENERLNEIVNELKRLLSLSLKMENNDDEHKRNLGEIKTSIGHKDMDEKVLHDDLAKDEALKGSILDNVASPISEQRTPQHKRVSSPFKKKFSSGDRNDHNIDSDSFGDENDKNSPIRVKALLSRFGDLVTRKHLNKKESSIQ